MAYINGFRFLREITPFDLTDYQVIVTWTISDKKPFKIYKHPGSVYFYLHDETINRLFEAELQPGKDLFENSNGMITAYRLRYPS